MKNSLRKVVLLATALVSLPWLAQAHPGHGATAGIAAGLAHPLSGLDHLCAMVAVGLWAAQRGGRAVWLVPLTFVSVMMLGAVAGAIGLPLPLVETGITVSVLVLGILIAGAVRLPVAASAMLVGLFAVFHGHAHGTEMPATGSGLSYAAGFAAVTALLHLAGIGWGLAMQRWGSEAILKWTGSAIAACGIWLLAVA